MKATINAADKTSTAIGVTKQISPSRYQHGVMLLVPELNGCATIEIFINRDEQRETIAQMFEEAARVVRNIPNQESQK